jgi:hypothetical protein
MLQGRPERVQDAELKTGQDREAEKLDWSVSRLGK